ncbi:MAG: Omp28-related outer membrane protein [Paludibacteraceae bacterium]|nr:Omp28-related outer membrane protein [Paludibacteraceae bacterium]
MKKRTLLIALIAIALSSCEVIGEDERYIPVPVPPAGTSRTHVLLEYTGFRCVNCPKAARTAQGLREAYGEQLLVVALHPAANPFTQGLYDYTCPAADSCYLWMGGDASTPFPTGNIDILRTDNGYFLDPSEWAGQLAQVLPDTMAPHVQTQALYDAGTRQIELTAYVYADSTTECRLAFWLTEDSISGAQAMPDGSVSTTYLHQHVLRSTAGPSPWGEDIRIDRTLSTRQAAMQLPEACNPAQCHVISLLLDKNDNHILNAYETKLSADSHAAMADER